MPARKPPEFRCRTGIRLIRELAADRIDVAGACRVLTVSMAGGLALGSTTKGRHHKLARGLGGSKVQTSVVHRSWICSGGRRPSCGEPQDRCTRTGLDRPLGAAPRHYKHC
jgi:hypothetical protein